MTIDYNWFFSSLSQCCAAIVGFFGAFLITKIINREIEYNSLLNRIVRNTTQILIQKTKFSNRYFEWYNRIERNGIYQSDKFNEYINSIYKVKKNIEYEKWIKDEIDKIPFIFTFSHFENLENLKLIIKEKIFQIFQEKMLNEKKSPYSSSTPYNFSNLVSQPKTNDEYDKIITEKTETKKLTNELILLQNDIEVFSKGEKIISYSLVSITLLFFIGIVYPLSFMPTLPGELSISYNPKYILETFLKVLFSIKGIILLLVSLSFSSIIIYFCWINIKQNFKNIDIEQIKEYQNITNYSLFLKNEEEYEKANNDYLKKEEESEAEARRTENNL